MGARFDFPFFCSLSEVRFSCLRAVRQTFTLLPTADSANKDCEPRQDKPNPTRGVPNTDL